MVTLAFAAVGTACGDSISSSPSPEVIATAESIARTVSFPAAYSTTPEKGDSDKDAIVLDARVFGSGPTGVILAHMRPADQASWYPYATELAASGKYTVMTFDFRGYGKSTGDKQFDRIDTDLDAAYVYMRDSLKLRKIFLVGASMGGTASLVVAAREEVAGVVSISSPGQFPPIDAEEHLAEIVAPKLFLTSKDDVPAARSQERFWDLAVEPKQQHVYEGDAHGTAIFDTENGVDLRLRITGFLDAY